MEDVLGISIIHDPGQHGSFDIVAVHGIKGHPHHTWTHPNGEKWLEEYLPKDLPDCRIMTFGYNAQIFTSSKGFVVDFAEQLLQHLMSVRRSTNSAKRPIIFLCHSLGGLVLKKALLLAHESHDAAEIRKSTIAIAFMGTPHRGSQLASYADIAMTCIKAVGIKANTANIQHLRLDSENLEEIGSQFGSLLQVEKIKILSFYELKPIRAAGIAEAVIVPPWSAKLGLGPPLETIIPVDADHRQIAQFSSRDSNQYGIVKSHLVSITSSPHQTESSHDQSTEDLDWNDILLWLDAFRSQSQSTLYKERVQGTCEWIFEKHSLQQWRSSAKSAGLWIYGKPGVGKTILASYISEVLKSAGDQTVLTIHCHAYRSLNDPVHAIVREILFQALQAPLLSIKVKQRLLEMKSQTNAMSDIAFDTLLNLVDEIFHGDSKIFLIVDGLDELNQKTAELEAFLQKAKKISQSTSPCKVLMVSRNTPSLEKLLGGWKEMVVSTSDSLRDISVFLNEKLENMTHLSHRRDEVIQRLVEGSKGLFLWADLAVTELDHLRTWNEIQALLENGNRGLDVTYATIIKQLDTSSEGMCRIRARALPIVAVACRPFQLEEITELLAVEVSRGFVDPGDRLLGGWNTLSRACGPFLQMNDLGVVELIHVSAKEFLLSHPWARSLATDYLMEGSAETEMVCLCLSYLNFTVFGRMPGENAKLDVESLSKQYPFLQYASTFWSNHVIRSVGLGENLTALQLSLLYQFLNSPNSVMWTTTFFPYFARKHGETYGSVLSTQNSMLSNLQNKLRIAGGVDKTLAQRCIDKCSRLLLESTQDSVRREQFHSGPFAEVTLDKKLRLAACYLTLGELDAATDISSEAFDAARKALGPLNRRTLQLERMKLYTNTRIHQRSCTLDSYDAVPDLKRLVNDHEQVFGLDHAETLACRHDLALVQLVRRDFIEARKTLEPLHQRMIRTLGRTSRVTHSVANNLAACANMQGEYDFAESILYTIPGLSKAAAEQLEIDITSISSSTLHSLSIFAAVLGARNEDHRSEVLHQRVIDGFIAISGFKTSRIYESAINKGQALRDQFKYTEARKHYLEWVKKSDQNFGSDSRHSREMRKRLLDLDEREKKWKEMSQSLKAPVVEVEKQPVWKTTQNTSGLALAALLAIVLAYLSIYLK